MNKSLTLRELLGVSFVVLKLSNVIFWSWWIVLIPFYMKIVIALFFSLFNLNKTKQKKRKSFEERIIEMMKEKKDSE